jgi:hypothetical protein
LISIFFLKKFNSTISLVRSLPKAEKKAFLSFLASPYFNKQARLQKLASYVLQHKPEAVPEKQVLHQVLYGEEAIYREQAVYDALSQLGKLLERFLALRELERDPSGQRRYLLAGLSQLQQENAFDRQWKKVRKKQSLHPYRDPVFFEDQYALYRQASEFKAGLQRRDQEEELAATVRFLDLHYWSARLKYSCELLNRRNILKQEAPDEWIAPLEKWLEALPQSYREEPAIKAYYLIFQALLAPENERRYQQWINWLGENSHLFSPGEAADMYNYAQNYCVRRINQGNALYLDRLFALFEQLVEKDLVLDQGYMDHRKLKNMVTVGIRLGAFDWVNDFLHSYREKLLPAYQEDAYLFNLASLRYAEGRHSEALTLLQKVVFKDVFYDLSARSLLLKLYYETDEDAALEFLMETFRIFLQRNRAISSFQKRIHLNLLRYIRKLYRLRERKKLIATEQFQVRLQKLKANITTAEDVANRSWLLEQVGRL